MALPTDLGRIRTRLSFDRRAGLPDGLIALVIVFAALAGGALTGMFGLLAVPLAGGVLVTMLVMLVGVEIWWRALIVLLFGYAFASRGFASIGVFPLFIGELVLALGLLTIVLIPFSDRIRVVNPRRFLSWPMLLLALFIISQVLQTIPYVGTYQFDTLRDAMVYGYAIFAVLVMLLISSRRIENFVQLYGRMIPLLLLWFPFLFFFSRISPFPVMFPGADVPLIFSRGSDAAVHLGGIAAFILLGLDDRHRPAWPPWLTPFLWALWVTSLAFYGALGRAALLAAGLSVALVLILRPLGSRWQVPLVLGVLGLSMLLATNTYYSFRVDLGLHREVSVQQFTNNITSIFTSSGTELDGTRSYRVDWWDAIIDYTIGGPYFWTGKGYGINLADDDGFQVDGDGALRSPHNGHLTLLARSGVPGFLIWVLFLGSVVLTLLHAAFVHQGRDSWRSRFAIWLLAYIMAHMLVTGFDVYLEGPMGGIWFWVTVGIALSYFRDPPQTADNNP